MDVFVELVRTLGFPIACVIFLAVYVKTMTDNFRADIKGLTEKYEQAIVNISDKYEKSNERMSKTLDRHSTILTTLEAKIEQKGETAL